MRFEKLLPLMVVFFSCFACRVWAETPSEIEIIFDASGSMNDAMGGTTKLDAAKQVMNTLAGQIQEGAKVGLRFFGTTPVQSNVKESCTDSVLALPILPFQKQAMIDKVQPIKSYGMTALGYALQKAGSDFSADPAVSKSVILISDGEETCGMDPLQVIADLKAKGISFQIHAIGFDASEAGKAQLKTLGETTGGSYHEAKDAGELEASLKKVAEESKLLTPQSKDVGENLISAMSGATVLAATEPVLAEMIDGSEKMISASFNEGAALAIAFKDKQPALVDSIALFLPEATPENISSVMVLGSVDAPDRGYFKVQNIKFENTVNFENLNQTVKLDQPMPLRYIKLVFGKSFKGGGVYRNVGYEIKAYGKLLTEDEFKAELAKIKLPDVNILSAENGGKLVASTSDRFGYAIDGKDGAAGGWGSILAGSQGIFSLPEDKTYLMSSFGTAIIDAAENNCLKFEVEVSETTPTGPYTKVGAFEAANMVFADDVVQRFNFEKPVKAKYLKVISLSGDAYYGCRLEELQAFGEAVNA